MSTRYFQGSSVTEPVKASDARSFSDVVDTFRICPVLPITRSAFFALTREKRNKEKQVPYFVASCFKHSPSKRDYQHATHCNLIFLDIDEMKDGRCPAAPFVSNPDSLYSALAGFNFAAHETASSTQEKPRIRVVVDADRIPLESYSEAVKTIASLLGLPQVTTESKVAVQPMFLPTTFLDSSEEEHPLFAHRLDGKTFKTSDISSENDFTDFHQVRETGDPGLDALNFLRAPVPEIKLSTAKEALEHIDADCTYFDWLEVAAALRHQFSPAQAEEAFELFDQWSSQGTKYGNEEETRAKWDSLRPTPIGRVPVTIRSLLRQAVAGGWDDKKIKESCFTKLVQWIDEVESLIDLIEDGPKKILATPLLSPTQESILVGMICSNAKRRFIHTVTASSIRKHMAQIKADIRARKPAEDLKEPPWVKGVCYVSNAQDFYRHKNGEKYKIEAFNNIYSRHLLPTEESLKEAGTQVTAATLSKPTVNPSDFALNSIKIPTVYDYAYDPSQPADMFIRHRGHKLVNTYSRTFPELDPKNAEAAGDLLIRHLKNLIEEKEYRRTILDFMSFMVQSPGEKIRWALLLQSVEGSGKTFLAQVMAAVLGDEHVKSIDNSAIRSGYNEWSFGHQLVVLEEVRVVGTNRHEIMNALKPLITNDTISINEKFRNQRQVPNISNYMAFSNYTDALALTPGDRRWFVVKSPLQNKSQVLALGEDYFPPLYAMLRDKAGALRSFLMDWDISPEFRANGHAPRTKYVQELINDTASDVTAGVRKLLIEGDYPLIQYDIVSSKKLMDVLQLEEGITRITSQHLAQVLREEGYKPIPTRPQINDEKHYIWIKSGVEESTAAKIAAEREKKGIKNLCMEVVYG